jgi:hypothetical protein
MSVYEYDKNLIKNSLSLEQVHSFLDDLGSAPQQQGNVILNRTICHCGNSHKLYYYDNTKLFRCYTDCGGEAFDIYELTRKVKSRENPKERYTKEGNLYLDEWNLPEAIEFVAQYFGFSPTERESEEFSIVLNDWKVLNNYDRIENISNETQKVELKTYDSVILANLPRPIIQPWIDEGITQEVMNSRGICYDPKNCGIVIPHYDIEGRLIGIRERTLIKENEDKGKYRPAFINRQLYNHPLSFNLYNLYYSKNNIKILKKAIIWEGEKSCLLYASYFGEDNDISVACCGSSLIPYQVQLLIDLGVEEIIIGFDKQFQEFNDDEHKKLVKNLRNIHKKYSPYVQISYMFDKWDLLGYKDSPIDRGPDTFLELFNRRIIL